MNHNIPGDGWHDLAAVSVSLFGLHSALTKAFLLCPTVRDTLQMWWFTGKSPHSQLLFFCQQNLLEKLGSGVAAAPWLCFMRLTVIDDVGQAAVSMLIHSLHSCCAVSMLMCEFVKKYSSHSAASINVCMHAHAFLCMCVCVCRSEVTILY